MQLFTHLLIQNLKAQFQYKADLFGHIAILAAMYAMKILFLSAVFDHTSSLAGWTRQEVYLVFYFSILASVLADIFDTSVLRFYRQVYLGTSEPYLLKPMQPLLIVFLRWSKPSRALIALLIAPFGWIFRDMVVDVSLLQAIVAVVCFFCGVIATILFVSTLSLLTFISQRQVPVDYIFTELYKLTQIPPSLLPRPILCAAAMLMPALFCAAAPAAVLLKADYSLAYAVVLGVALLATLHTALFNRMLKNFDGLGG